MLNDFGYVIEPTGADSPSQNGGAEIYNNTLAMKTRTLLYGAGLPPHAVLVYCPPALRVSPQSSCPFG